LTRVQRNQKHGWRNSRSEERVRKAVKELNNGKSCGPEGVYAEMLKHGTDKMINSFDMGNKQMLKWRRSSTTIKSCLHFINTQKRKQRRLF
jgi:hypothetical protein